MDVRNPFTRENFAARYAKHRPITQRMAIRKFQEFAGVERVGRALDVACGTGHLTQFLAGISNEVIAIDNSQEMLDAAIPMENVRYLLADAESFASDKHFDAITVGLAFHWLDQERFLGNARRLLNDAGWLVLYTNGFTGKMAESEPFQDVMKAIWRKYPSPPRHKSSLDRSGFQRHGFDLRMQEQYSTDVKLSQNQLTEFLLTQSNIIHEVDTKGTSLEDIRREVGESIRPFFKGECRSLVFYNELMCLHPIAPNPVVSALSNLK